ncbi:MAG: AAA family ATPase [Proteobacteria bacterium]|nr:AAA family ATPase [Pseudomonadota bacterium]
MQIAISGTHYMGKTTLIADFIKNYPHYKHEIEPYYQLEDKASQELALEPSFDNLLEQLEYSLEQLHKYAKYAHEKNIIFDRCPVDFLAYAMYALDEDYIDINESEISEKFTEIKEALTHLDLIVFLPMLKEYPIEYSEDNPNYRKAIDQNFKKLYWDEKYDIFPDDGAPKIIEVSGNRQTRLKLIESHLIRR